MSDRKQLEPGLIMSLSLRSFCLLFLAIAFSGCTKKSTPAFVPAEGRVFRADGKPLPILKIEFVPFPFSDIKSDSVIPFALSDERGQFSVRAADAGDPKIPSRKYKVTVKGMLPATKGAVPVEYGDPLTTPFEIEATGAEILLEIK